MAIDIFSIEPNKISRDLKGKYVLVYSLPKVGKTSLAAQFPRALLCAFEIGYHALPGIKPIDIGSWVDFKKVVQQLKLPKAKEMYDTIIIDTVSIATDLCEKYILAQNDVAALGDIPWGGGWSQYKKEFDTPFRELTQLGYGIVFICHSKEVNTGIKDADGNDIKGVAPDINKTGLNTVNRLVDIIGYISQEFQPDGTSKRYFYTRQTPTVFAGSRYKYLAPKIEFGYEPLVNAIADAIEKEASEGAGVTDNTVMAAEPIRPFADAMSEAKELWTALVGSGNAENVEKINASIVNAFGQKIKLSEVTENQQELLEIVISDMKNM